MGASEAFPSVNVGVFLPVFVNLVLGGGSWSHGRNISSLSSLMDVCHVLRPFCTRIRASWYSDRTLSHLYCSAIIIRSVICLMRASFSSCLTSEDDTMRIVPQTTSGRDNLSKGTSAVPARWMNSFGHNRLLLGLPLGDEVYWFSVEDVALAVGPLFGVKPSCRLPCRMSVRLGNVCPACCWCGVATIGGGCSAPKCEVPGTLEGSAVGITLMTSCLTLLSA